MLKAIRTALETYASGMGVPARDVIREFRALDEADKFRMLAAIKELEKKHQEWEANGGKPPAPPEPAPAPQVDLAAIAREQRGDYAMRRLLGRQSLIVDRAGRPFRRDP
jgi:hypothetical protein